MLNPTAVWAESRTQVPGRRGRVVVGVLVMGPPSALPLPAGDRLAPGRRHPGPRRATLVGHPPRQTGRVIEGELGLFIRVDERRPPPRRWASPPGRVAALPGCGGPSWPRCRGQRRLPHPARAGPRRHPSAQVLAALGDAMRLGDEEWTTSDGWRWSATAARCARACGRRPDRPPVVRRPPRAARAGTGGRPQPPLRRAGVDRGLRAPGPTARPPRPRAAQPRRLAFTDERARAAYPEWRASPTSRSRASGRTPCSPTPMPRGSPTS